MNPCYNSIALARHQNEIDRQEAKEHWIAAAVDRLIDDDEFLGEWAKSHINITVFAAAKKRAEAEYQQHLSALEQARIDAEVGYDG